MSVRCLSIHASYRCGHSGACCTAGWPIPIDAPLRARLEGAIESGRLAGPVGGSGDGPAFVEPPARPSEVAAILGVEDGGTCAFYDRRGRRCSIHRDLGPSALPPSCQHFPRVCLIDDDEAFVTLSHFCPTAARLLFDNDADVAVVEAPAALSAGIRLEGLDARGALPPLLRPGMLTDRESYRAWEGHAVSTLGAARSAEEGLLRVMEATEEIRSWRPGEGDLRSRVEAAFDQAAGPPVFERPDSPVLTRVMLALDAAVRGAVPDGLPCEPAPPEVLAAHEAYVVPTWHAWASPVRRYLAARAFGNWCAYLGRGLRSVTWSVAAALAVLHVEAARQAGAAGRLIDADLLREAVRSTDLLLLHLASREELARRFGEVEQAPPAAPARLYFSNAWS